MSFSIGGPLEIRTDRLPILQPFSRYWALSVRIRVTSLTFWGQVSSVTLPFDTLYYAVFY